MNNKNVLSATLYVILFVSLFILIQKSFLSKEVSKLVAYLEGQRLLMGII